MQQPIDASTPAPIEAGLVVAVLATGQERLRSALRRVAAAPELIAVTTRIVVLETGRTTSLLQEAVRLPVGLLRVVQQTGPTRAEALARLLLEAAAEPLATAVLVLDDAALSDPSVLLEAFACSRRSSSTEVVGLRDRGAEVRGPAGWWGAVLPIDAVRAIGATLPEAGEVALADVALRAEATGFRFSEHVADGPVPVIQESDLLLLALLHGPIRARRALLAGAVRRGTRDGLQALLRGPETRGDQPLVRVATPRLRLWLGWASLRRRYRAGAVVRASAEAWTLRFLDAGMNPALPGGEHGTAVQRPAGLRSPAWSTTERGTSAA